MDSSQAEITPYISHETARIFLAEGDEARKTAVLAALGEAGLAQNVQMASTWHEAREFVDSQVPGELSANIFLFGAVLDHSGTPNAEAGRRLAAHLSKNYELVFSAISQEATKMLRDSGLTAYEAHKMTGNREILRQLAAKRLQSEALVVCISAESGVEAQGSVRTALISRPAEQLALGS